MKRIIFLCLALLFSSCITSSNSGDGSVIYTGKLKPSLIPEPLLTTLQIDSNIIEVCLDKFNDSLYYGYKLPAECHNFKSGTQFAYHQMPDTSAFLTESTIDTIWPTLLYLSEGPSVVGSGRCQKFYSQLNQYETISSTKSCAVYFSQFGFGAPENDSIALNILLDSSHKDACLPSFLPYYDKSKLPSQCLANLSSLQYGDSAGNYEYAGGPCLL